MGQAKHNPTAIAAKKGELPPKPKKMGKRDLDRWIYAQAQAMLAEKTGLPHMDMLVVTSRSQDV